MIITQQQMPVSYSHFWWRRCLGGILIGVNGFLNGLFAVCEFDPRDNLWQLFSAVEAQQVFLSSFGQLENQTERYSPTRRHGQRSERLCALQTSGTASRQDSGVTTFLQAASSAHRFDDCFSQELLQLDAIVLKLLQTLDL